MLKIAIILPKYHWDYLANTLLDGLFQLQAEQSIECRLSSRSFFGIPAGGIVLSRNRFVRFAQKADLILFCYGKEDMDTKLAQQINCWEKTIFVDGSELGKDRRYDLDIKRRVLEETWVDHGRIDREILKGCALYFRREKPYKEGTFPLPYGIESRYVHYVPGTKKDIDFCCIFGQEQHPVLRREVRQELERFCKENGFVCATEPTKDRDEFYEILSRTKVGISVGGGGFDTARFWEILANNCLLMTEKIDIDPPRDSTLAYDRIFEFQDINEFKKQLVRVAGLLRNAYPLPNMEGEYQKILSQHSSKSRMTTVLDAAKERGIIPSHRNVLDDRCAVVISSCDAFEDVWRPFFTLFFRYWPDCPYPIYLITNEKSFKSEHVSTIHVVPDRGWSSNLKEALEHIPNSHIIYLQEDYLLRGAVDATLLKNVLDHSIKKGVSCFRLFPSPGPDKPYQEFPNTGRIGSEAPYRFSTQAAVWNADFLRAILVEGETGWDMEGPIGQARVKGRGIFLSVKKPILDYFPETAIKKGRWYFDAVRFCRREGIFIDTKKRSIETRWEFMRRKLKQIVRSIRSLARLIIHS